MHLPPETNMPTKPQENHNQQQKQKQKKNSTLLHAHVYLCSFISNVLLSRLKSSQVKSVAKNNCDDTTF